MRFPSRPRASSSLLLAFALIGGLAAGALPAQTEEACPCPPPPPPPPLWTGSLGLSYLSTTGNSETETFGFTTNWKREPTPWGLEIAALANRAESEGLTTAERYFAALRGKRALSERWELFGGLSWEQDEFAGFDSREIVEAGALWKALLGPVHELAFDAGATWTTEDPVIGESDDWIGALAGLAYAWHIGENAKFSERLVWYPNFDVSDDWRVRSETALEAALASSWALRVSYLFTRDNLPPPGFEKDDGTTAVSIVWKR